MNFLENLRDYVDFEEKWVYKIVLSKLNAG